MSSDAHEEMKSPVAGRLRAHRMKILTFLLLFGGTALFVALIVEQGVGNVYRATAAAGWGVLVVAAFHVVPMIADSLAWQTMMARGSRLTTPATLRIRWISESVNNLLPAAPVSGDLVRTRLAVFGGLPGPVAGASVTADLTFGALSQCVFSLMGVAALIYLGASFDNTIVAGISVGLTVIAILLTAFLVLQNFGLFKFLAGLAARAARGRLWLDIIGGAEALDRELSQLYGRRRRIAYSMFWRLFGWIAGAGEVWLTMYYLGHPIGVIEAIMVESVIQAIRAAAFAVPGALGIQEAGFVLLGSYIGIGADLSLALALVRRARELAFGIPALIAWQIQEGNRALRRGRD